MGKLVFKNGRAAVRQEGNAIRYLGRQYEGGKLVHYRGYRVDLAPHIERVKLMALRSSVTGETSYQASIPREVLDDWLRKREKDWNQYATDQDLKKEFYKWFKREYPALCADFYRERSLKTNRATAPRLGASILNSYRLENSNERNVSRTAS
jgi:hypothetical protein